MCLSPAFPALPISSPSSLQASVCLPVVASCTSDGVEGTGHGGCGVACGEDVRVRVQMRSSLYLNTV